MSSLFGRRAVVIGSGIGGLSAAAVLAGYFEQVELLERDQIAVTVQSRPGTPQDRHPHGLLAGGLKALALIEVGQLLQPASLLHEPHMRERIEAVAV